MLLNEDVIVSIDDECFMSFINTGATKLNPRNKSGAFALRGIPGESKKNKKNRKGGP
jgi:hypothetical protein